MRADGSSVVRGVLIVGLAVIAVSNLLLFTWLNGDGFVLPRAGGYWSLRVEPEGDFTYVIENQPHVEMATPRFYLRLRQFAEGKLVTFPPGTLDPVSIRALTLAEPIPDSSYETELDPAVIEAIEEDQVVTGALFEGPDYVIIPPSTPAHADYRLMSTGQTLVLVPESRPDPLESGVEG
jgi:hypothetical protein